MNQVADKPKPIGWYLPEAAHPYHILHKDFEIVGASPKGGEAPVDENSVKQFMDDQGKFFLEDKDAKKVWQSTIKISEVKASDYKAIFVVGGVSLPLAMAIRPGDLETPADFCAARTHDGFGCRPGIRQVVGRGEFFFTSAETYII